MAAVSGPLDGRTSNHRESIERDYTIWEYTRPKSQERKKPSFSKPFSANNRPNIERKTDHPSHILQQTAGNPSLHNYAAQSGYDEQEFILGPHNQPRAISSTDPTHLSPHDVGLHRPTNLNASRSGSEPDSLLDLYGRPISGVDGVNNTDQSISKEANYNEDEDSEHSRWIHRDKLALIESHEMQEAGIKLPRPGRSNSKPKSSIEQGRDQYKNGAREHGQDTDHMGWGKSQGSQIPLSQQEVENGSGINGHEFDLRTLEEINAEPHHGKNSPPLCRQPGLRSSSSRIPLPKSSPMPIPQEHIERNTPLPRKRGASGNWSGGDEDGIAYDKARRRSQSVGSQVLLDEGEMLNDVQGDTRKWNDNDSPSTSPSKRLANKTVQPLSFGTRKTSNALRNVSDVQKPRTSSNTYRSSPSNRPKSRSGLEPRPSATINRPEGDPPWLATMFKPDPRLPPDQQLLPTHAKRLQQEKNVVSGSTLEGDYDPVAVSYPDELPLPSLQPDSELKEKDPNHESAWPLKSSPNKESGSPGLGGTEHGGYSTIPKVQRTPSVGAIPSPKPLQQPKQEEKVAKKASCGCCVVM